LARSATISAKVARVYGHRSRRTAEEYSQRLSDGSRRAAEAATDPRAWWLDASAYATDFAQRSVLFWDTLRRRGNGFVEHERDGLPPVLHFDYETVLDARELEHPVNYALVRILPPDGVRVDPKRRPYIIIDPRAGHGPGIGGFKDDSQVGVALRDGHPVYFVIFFQRPEPGQTLLDVCEAERAFVHKVHELHPDSARPAIVGNCQGGWAAMMVAATMPEDCGPLVINGAPMSYWGGAWSEGKGDNPMRYAGGLAGGSWVSSLSADLGNGIFDGAWLVQNFENLNPANTYWDKFYNLFAKVDTESERFLDFERWWGGFYLMSTDEIEWIVQNLFVGNKLWNGETLSKSGDSFDLRAIRSPIILFASMGDNITPPQQAFNWIADVYGSTEEIISRGQVIVGLLHEDIGHLGIFVSGKVATKEHSEIVSVMKSIEALPPGLYAMKIDETRTQDGAIDYQVEFVPKRLEDVMARLNRFERRDEKAFEAVAHMSEFNQRGYELFGRPIARAFANEPAADLGRHLHPLRFQRWSLSDLNPWGAWLAPAAEFVGRQRKPAEPDNPFRQLEAAYSSMVSASFDCYRAMRDATYEAMFFQTFGTLHSLYLADEGDDEAQESREATDPRELPFVREALAAIAEGGYPEAVARVGYLLWHKGDSFELWQIERRAALLKEYRHLMPDVPDYEMRRIRGQQALICTFEPERAIETLPRLLADPADRARLTELLERVESDPRIDAESVTAEQRETFERIQTALGTTAGADVRPLRRANARRRAT
jgi:pimeloyl-ACP methyl ester carboxylesterase